MEIKYLVISAMLFSLPNPLIIFHLHVTFFSQSLNGFPERKQKSILKVKKNILQALMYKQVYHYISSCALPNHIRSYRIAFDFSFVFYHRGIPYTKKIQHNHVKRS